MINRSYFKIWGWSSLVETKTE